MSVDDAIRQTVREVLVEELSQATENAMTRAGLIGTSVNTENSHDRLTLEAAADRLGISTTTLRRRFKEGAIKHFHDGGKIYVLLGEIWAYNARLANETPEVTTNSDKSIRKKLKQLQ